MFSLKLDYKSIYCTWTKLTIATNFLLIVNEEIRVEKGKKKKWVRIINIYLYIYSAWYIRVSMRLKKETRQVNQKFFEFKRGNIGIVNMHKKYRRQDRDAE